MAATSRVEGVARLVDSLDAAATELSGLTSRAGVEAGQLIQTRAESTAPRRTGHLAGSHDTVVAADHLSVVNAATYASYVHARDPWLARSLEDQLSDLLDTYAAAVAAAVALIEGT